jgi:hypothetical protein
VLALARQTTTPGWWTSYGDILADWFETYPVWRRPPDMAAGWGERKGVIHRGAVQYVRTHGKLKRSDA